LTSEDIKFLWFRDKAYNLGQPSIDRKDTYGDYSIDNCRFIEKVDNVRRAKAKRGVYKKRWNTGEKSPSWIDGRSKDKKKKAKYLREWRLKKGITKKGRI
ncbi:hypothetical protein KAT51_06675, partial [bacterium]|nr:hypothetical protein [bacterium]